MTRRTSAPPVEPLGDLAHARIERRVLEALEAPTYASRPAARRRWPIAVALVGVAAAAAIAVVVWRGAAPAVAPVPETGAHLAPGRTLGEPQRVVTHGAPSTVTFAEAELTVAPASALLLVGDVDHAPLIVLDRGEVTLSVAARGARPPLVVAAGAVRVTVIGTRFTVTRDGDAARVVVDHGTVDILFDGQVARVHGGATWLPTVAPTAVAATAPPDARPPPDAPVAVAPPVVVDPRARQRQFEAAQDLEGRAPREALRAYQALARGRDAWAANATFAAARLSAELGDRAAAARLATQYLTRFPAGANAADARALGGTSPAP